MKLIKSKYKILIQVVLLLIVIILGFKLIKFAKSNSAIREAIHLATTIQPETFTELYFENHTQLPNKIIGWNKYPFSFTIHNLEDKDMEYPYSVYTVRNDKKVITYQEDKVTIKKGEYKTITVTIKALKPLDTKVVVDLTDKNQQISFLMNTKGKASPTAKVETKATVKPEVVATKETKQPLKMTTELYFTPNKALPFLLTDTNKTINFSFTIRNLVKDSVYPFSVYMDNNGQITQIDKGQISLKRNENKTITESYTITTPFNQAKIFVKLTNKNNYIYFKLKQN
ncbi:MAG: hypothetical protein WC895_04010 [Candidatus Shapirobacteria bacterium]|jgi:hypothetical protein